MNKTQLNRKKGSTLLSVLFFATIVMILLATATQLVINDFSLTHRTVASGKAFHVAESGIERAIYALQHDQFPTGVWSVDESGKQFLEFDVEAGKKSTHCRVELEVIDSENYAIISTGTTAYGNHTTSRTIRVLAEVAKAKEGVANYCQPDFIFREHIFFRPSNQLPFQAGSWNSQDSRDPIFKPANNSNTGYDVIIASLLDTADAIDLSNAWIDGSIGVAGEHMPLYHTYEQYPNMNQDVLRARLKGPNTPDDVLFDPDRVIKHFEYNIVIPTCPDPADYHVYREVPQNEWSGKKEAVLGELNKRTFIRVRNSFNPSNIKFTVQGDVFMYVEGPINVQGNIDFYMNGDDSTFTIMSQENMSFGDSNGHPEPLPSPVFSCFNQKNSGNITVHNKRFSGYIYAPNSADSVGTVPRIVRTMSVIFFWVELSGNPSTTPIPSSWLVMNPWNAPAELWKTPKVRS